MSMAGIDETDPIDCEFITTFRIDDILRHLSKDDAILSKPYVEGKEGRLRTWHVYLTQNYVDDKGVEWIGAYIELGDYSGFDVAPAVSVRFTLRNQLKKPHLEKCGCRIKYAVGKRHGWPDFIRKSELIDPNMGYIKNGMILIMVMVLVTERPKTAAWEYPVYPPTPNLCSVFDVERFSDVKVKCGSRTFHCSKVILAARSKVFHAMFSLDMIESITGEVEITDFSEKAMEKVLKFMYNDDYVHDEEVVAQVIEAAEKYDLVRLKSMCENSLINFVSKENAIKSLILAKQFSLLTLKNKVLDFLKTCESKDIQL